MQVVQCHCGKQSQLKTFWTTNNPARRFLSCPDYGRVGACRVFSWVDPPICNRAKDVIPGLLRRISMLEEQLKRKRSRERFLIATMLLLSWVMFVGLSVIASGANGSFNEEI